MGFGLSLRKKRSKEQSRSKTDEESSDLPQPNPCSKDSLKLKSKSNVGQANSDPCHRAKHDVKGKVQHLHSAKGSSTQPDELVKYMSSLPGFLKRSDGAESIQGKALNVGVLDWSQLEKWKNKQTHTKAEASNFTSFNSSEETSSSSTTSGGHNKKLVGRKGSSSSRSKGPYKEDLPRSSKMSSQNAKRYQHSETETTKTIGDELGMSPSEFSKTRSDTLLQRVKVNDYDEITSIVESSASTSRDVEDKKRMEGLQQHSLKKKERSLKSSSDKGFSSLESKNKGVSFDSQKKMSASRSEAKKKMDQWQEPDIDAGHKQTHRMPSNIVLLRPPRVLQLKSENYFQHSQSRTSSDEDFLESNRSSLSYMSIPEEVYTEDVHSEIPHSSGLHSVTELASSSETLQHSINTDLDMDRSSIVSKKPACSNNISNLQSEDTCIEKDVLDIKLKNQCAFSNVLKSLDQETPKLTPQNPSSNRRLSLSLSRIGRSLSFKEGSIPKHSSMYVSAKSGPVTPESDAYLDTHRKGHNRTMSSPLMRLLDPIFKRKASNLRHSDEKSVTSKGSMDSIGLRTINLLPDEKSMESSIQALLQLTIRNGVPLFRFVLNSETKVLAATMKSVASPEKDDVDCYFTFYLVNEIKKKSGNWMSHWSKEKNCGYVYNIVGQMKVSSSKSKTTKSSNENSKRESVVKEYVLMGVEVDQLDQEPPKFFMSKELAAVVIEIPCENINHEGPLYSHNLLRKRCLKCLADEKCICSSQENEIYQSNTTVILPGGVHSSPNTGQPSSLIHRWKLGGLCDCGGWDVGCKLLVLSNQDLSSNTPRSSKSYLEKFHLFVQEGADQNTPLFTLVPLKDGFYSVEFSSEINHLQAFFISVAVLSSHNLPSSLEMNNMQEAINKEFSSKNDNELQGKEPFNYNPIPPYSPADRV